MPETDATFVDEPRDRLSVPQGVSDALGRTSLLMTLSMSSFVKLVNVSRAP